MRAHALNLRIARLTIDDRLVSGGRIDSQALAEAVGAELSAVHDGGGETAVPDAARVGGTDTQRIARTIAGAVSGRLGAIAGSER